MKLYNLQDVKAMALKAIDSKPKGRAYVYRASVGTKCVNVHVLDDGTREPSCIVGNIACQIVGVENVDPVGNVEMTLSQTGITVTWAAQRWMEEIQDLQDQGVAWGDAYDGANEAAERNHWDDVSAV